MSKNTMKRAIGTAVLALGLLTSGVSFAHGGGGGGWHGGGWHGGGWNGGYYGGWGGWGWGPGVVVGFPDDDYYAPACQTIRVCNSYGHCWLQDSCY
ncbi:MAG: hypothetical protein ACRCXC_01830 [Legionella sp.]